MLLQCFNYSAFIYGVSCVLRPKLFFRLVGEDACTAGEEDFLKKIEQFPNHDIIKFAEYNLDLTCLNQGVLWHTIRVYSFLEEI